MARITTPLDDALVITTTIDGFETKRILIDGGSSLDILLLDAFKNMTRNTNDLKGIDFPLIRFAGSAIYPLRDIRLSVNIGEGWKYLTIYVLFIIVGTPTSYYTIHERTTINSNGIVPSTVHKQL